MPFCFILKTGNWSTSPYGFCCVKNNYITIIVASSASATISTTISDTIEDTSTSSAIISVTGAKKLQLKETGTEALEVTGTGKPHLIVASMLRQAQQPSQSQSRTSATDNKKLYFHSTGLDFFLNSSLHQFKTLLFELQLLQTVRAVFMDCFHCPVADD
jgi:hypothetical protein